jgi:putative methyltransferase (TIGR04325 family)
VIQSLIDFYWLHKKKRGWFGDYKTWQDAEGDCEGYDSDTIFEKVRAATRKVIRGEAAYERDSVLFFQKEENVELVKCLKNLKNTEGVVKVLDFGGAMGSLYFQHRHLSDSLNIKNWCVVEQAHFVAAGKEFEDNILSFEKDFDKALADIKPNIVIFSSVIQYLEKPLDWLTLSLKASPSIVFLDRLIVTDKEKDIITKQVVSPKIYSAAYPCWLFSESKLKAFLKKSFIISEEYKNDESCNVLGSQYKGFVLKIKKE